MTFFQTDTEKKTYSHCCYLEDDTGSSKACLPITKETFDGLEKVFQEAEKAGNKGKGVYDCNSSYIKIGILSLLFAVLEKLLIIKSFMKNFNN